MVQSMHQRTLHAYGQMTVRLCHPCTQQWCWELHVSSMHTAVVLGIACVMARMGTTVMTVRVSILCAEDATAGDTYSECVHQSGGTVRTLTQVGHFGVTKGIKLV